MIMPIDQARVVRRKAWNSVASGLAILTTAVALGWLAAVLFSLTVNGIAALSPSLFTQNTPPPGGQGGLANAIVGSLILTGLAILVAAPVGVLAGTYLSEISPDSPLARTVRFVSNLLLSAPSIIIGLFVYEIMVVPMGSFSALAGMVALAIIALPIVVHTTETMLSLVPDTLREAAAALGAPRWKMVVAVVWRSALQGILTGALLAVARISGETAPLLFTALNNQFWSTDLTRPIANLPVVIFQFAMSPYEDWRRLAWAGALIVTVGVLGLNVTARLLAARRDHGREGQ